MKKKNLFYLLCGIGNTRGETKFMEIREEQTFKTMTQEKTDDSVLVFIRLFFKQIFDFFLRQQGFSKQGLESESITEGLGSTNLEDKKINQIEKDPQVLSVLMESLELERITQDLGTPNLEQTISEGLQTPNLEAKKINEIEKDAEVFSVLRESLESESITEGLGSTNLGQTMSEGLQTPNLEAKKINQIEKDAEVLSMLRESLESKTISEDLRNKFEKFNTDIFVLFTHNEQEELFIIIFDKHMASPLALNSIQDFSSIDPIKSTSKILLKKKKTFEEINQYIKKEDSVIYDNSNICVSGEVFLSSLTEVRIMFRETETETEQISPQKIFNMKFVRKIKTCLAQAMFLEPKETKIEDTFLNLLTRFFFISFDEIKIHISSKEFIEYKNFNMVFEIVDGMFKKKSVIREHWQETIVPEKEISNLSKNFCPFFFDIKTDKLFFLQNGKFSVLDYKTFLELKIVNMPLALKIQEKAKQKKNFLSILGAKQKNKQYIERYKTGILSSFVGSFSEREFSIKQILINNNLLTEEEILDIINQA